ncbi:cysteine desulfurase family protein [Metabacillus indicus]|uniref:cysteine desulfurase family protein n=1 Tax=Metabacillus indicus TaxID=246786 RepID=UPI002A0992CC|nr:cysteine desulfurase family protein [Metabacillus indicus]MDX8289951.1 cysteine desulfurase family protein [Metabacillus indicus]
MDRIYLDHAATSPMHPAVIEQMVPHMQNVFGNPSSIHGFGRESRRLLDEARSVIAASLHARPKEIIFTSGGTEADNMAILGTASAYRHKGNHIITTQVEHHAVLNTCKNLEKQGFEVTYLPVGTDGSISIEEFKKALKPETILVTIMYGNNETGSVQPVQEIGMALKNHSALFHTDAVQAYGLLDINVKESGIDMLSASGHKINGPKGTGFLYLREGLSLKQQSFGGEQELKRRAGTENVPGIYGLKAAAELALKTKEEKAAQYREFKQKLLNVLKEEEVSFDINGTLEDSLPHVLNLYFPGTNVEAMLVNMDLAGIAVSSGSACTAGSIEPSHVLTAMYGDHERTKASIRFSFGYGNTLNQIEKTARVTAGIVKRLTA